MKVKNPNIPKNLSDSYFDNALDGLAFCKMIFDSKRSPVDFVYLKVNNNFIKMTGLKDVTGKKVSELVPGIRVSNPEIFEIYGRVSLTQKPERFETYVAPLRRWFLISVSSPKKNYFLAAFQNVNEQKRALKDLENAKIAAVNVLSDLQEEKDKLAEITAKDEALLQSIGDGVVATDREGKVILLNKKAVSLLGYTSQELMGKVFSSYVSLYDSEGKMLPDKRHPLTMALVTGRIFTNKDDFFARKNGVRFPVEKTASPVKIGSKIIGAIAVFRDITGEKEVERAKTEFISIASHQLRTPISGISWLIEALQSGADELPAKQKKYIKDLSLLCKRLITLLEDLLNFSRIELQSPIVVEKEEIEVNDFVSRSVKEMGQYASLKKKTIVSKSSIPDSIKIESNKKSLYNVLQNLLTNAIDYSPPDTKVLVELAKDEDSVRISISNKGQPIPESDHPKVFQRFYRSVNAKKIKPEGTGLGLYITKKIVDQLGGEIGFRSEDGAENVFWFTLPLNSDKK